MAIEFHVLAGVDDIKPGHPEQDGHRQQDWRPFQVAAQGDPGRDRRQAQREPQPEVGETGESLGVGIAQQPEQYRDRQEDRPSIRKEQECRGDEGRCGDDREQGDRAGAEPAGREVSAGRPGVQGVVMPIGQTVEGHRCRASRRHAEQDADPVLKACRSAIGGVGGQHGAQNREGESEQRVAELDSSK